MIRRRSTSLAAALTLAALLGACNKGEQASNQPSDSSARNLTLAPSDSSGAMKDVPVPTKAPATNPPAARPTNATPTRTPPPPAPPRPTTRTIAAGTVFDAAVTDTITSRKNHVGDAFTAHVVVDAGASASAIPSGAEIHGTIVEVKPAPNPSTPGTLTLAVSSITINGKSYDVEAKIDSLETVRQGRGVTTGDAAKVGVGAAAGAILGRVIGGNRKGTIIGGVVGAAAGAGVAATSKDSDIVLPAGAHIHLTLTKALVVAAR
jgi:glycine zipper 2TM protein